MNDDSYLNRFPADHRESAERAYSDGVEDALNHMAAPVLDAARAVAAAWREHGASPLLMPHMDVLQAAVAEFDS